MPTTPVPGNPTRTAKAAGTQTRAAADLLFLLHDRAGGVGGRHLATLIAEEVFQRKPSRQQFERVAPRLRQWGMHLRLRQLKQIYCRTTVVSERRLQGRHGCRSSSRLS